DVAVRELAPDRRLRAEERLPGLVRDPQVAGHRLGDPRVGRDERGVAVLVGRGPGEVVAAVGVRGRLTRLGVAVLRLHQAFVRGRVRHPGRPARLHLAAEHGYDLGAE